MVNKDEYKIWLVLFRTEQNKKICLKVPKIMPEIMQKFYVPNILGRVPKTPPRTWPQLISYIIFIIYEGRSKSFEPYPFKRKVDKWAYLYFSAYSPPLSVHSL